MTELLLLVFGLLIVAVVWWVVMQRKRKRCLQAESNLAIAEALDRVDEEVKQKSLHVLQPPSEGTSAIAQLQSLSADFPEGLESDVLKIRSLVEQLGEQLDEFSAQSAQTTLQSSILTNRNIKVAEEIYALTNSARQKLV